MNKQILPRSLILLFFILIISKSAFGIVEKLSIEEKIKRADAIMMGTVEYMQSQWEEANGGKRIFTYVYIDVEQYIKGIGERLVEIKVPGGKVGEITEWVSDTPQFTPGEKVILFLKPGFFRIVGWYQGKYTVKDDKVLGLGVKALDFLNMIQKIEEETYFGPYDALPTQIHWSGEDFKTKETPGIGEPCKEELSKEVLKSTFIKNKDEEKKEISDAPPLVSSVVRRTSASWTTMMQEDFEGTFPSGSWSVFGDPTWNDDDFKPYGGSWSAWCANGCSSGLDPASSNYPNNMNSWMVYGPFDLSDASDAELLFYYWNESESGSDYFKWMASTNGTTFYGYQVSGNSGGWQYVNFDLTSVPTLGNLCGDSTVWIAFKFDSNSSITYKGAFVDNIILQKATEKPNLTPYQPSSWADKIVVSNHTGDNDDDSPLFTTDTLYIDFAIINNGATATKDTFYTRLYVDDVLRQTWYADPPLEPGYYASVLDYSIGALSAGNHTIKIVTDYDNRITETDEGDNEYQRTINIVAGDPPQISSISPSIASAGTDTTVTINGTNFGAIQGTSKVEFFYQSGRPKIEAPIVSWSNTQILCKIPTDMVGGYPASSSSGPVTVTRGNETSIGYAFKITFGYGDLKWPGTHPWVFYKINENTSDCAGEGEAFIASANEWNNSCASFTFVYDGSTSATDYSLNGHNEVMWGTTGGAIAVCAYWVLGGEIFECDIVFEDTYTWCTDGSVEKMDVQNIATHELGHCLNLRDIYGDIGDEEYDTAKTMYGIGIAGETKKRTLHSDDISGIRWIYGIGGDSWDSTDDTGTGGTILTPQEGTWQFHGRHTLTSCDQYDWFVVNMTAYTSYYFKSSCDFPAISTEHGDVIAYLYSDSSGTNQARTNDDSGGNSQFEFSYRPSTSGNYYLRVNNYTPGKFWSGNINYKKELEDSPPSVSIISPADGETVSGTVNIEASASDDNEVIKVEFIIDDELKSTDINSPYTYSWDTQTYSNGTHKVEAVAYDNENKTDYHEISVTVENYALTISADAGGTTDPAPGTYIYDTGTQVTITATPDTGYRFANWSGDASGTDNPITITMDADKSITANFIRQYTLTIAVGSGGGGTTNPTTGTSTHDSGTQVSVTATPNTGYEFSGWTGDATGTTNPITITMDSDKSVTANFIRQYILAMVAGTGGTTDPSPGNHIYDVATQVSVRAIPNSGYRFTGWSGDASGTTNPITITMDSDKSIKANFAKEEPPAEKKGGCFIATVAYGSLLHPYVKILRDFRDKYLMPSNLGRALVYFYYKHSPFVADFITRHKVLKVAVRISLLPFVAFSYSMLHFGLIITTVMLVLVSVFPIFLISFFQRRKRRVEAKSPTALASMA